MQDLDVSKMISEAIGIAGLIPAHHQLATLFKVLEKLDKPKYTVTLNEIKRRLNLCEGLTSSMLIFPAVRILGFEPFTSYANWKRDCKYVRDKT